MRGMRTLPLTSEVLQIHVCKLLAIHYPHHLWLRFLDTGCRCPLDTHPGSPAPRPLPPAYASIPCAAALEIYNLYLLQITPRSYVALPAATASSNVHWLLPLAHLPPQAGIDLGQLTKHRHTAVSSQYRTFGHQDTMLGEHR